MKKFDLNSSPGGRGQKKSCSSSALATYRKQILSAVHKPRSVGFRWSPSSTEKNSGKTFAFSFIIKHSGNVSCWLFTPKTRNFCSPFAILFSCLTANWANILQFPEPCYEKRKEACVFICLFTVYTSFSAFCSSCAWSRSGGTEQSCVKFDDFMRWQEEGRKKSLEFMKSTCVMFEASLFASRCESGEGKSIRREVALEVK